MISDITVTKETTEEGQIVFVARCPFCDFTKESYYYGGDESGAKTSAIGTVSAHIQKDHKPPTCS